MRNVSEVLCEQLVGMYGRICDEASMFPCMSETCSRRAEALGGIAAGFQSEEAVVPVVSLLASSAV